MMMMTTTTTTMMMMMMTLTFDFDVSNNGLDLGDGGPPLLDLRFADDILSFAGSAEQLGYMLDKLVTSLGKVGLKLNAAKTKVLTTQAQPPKTLTYLYRKFPEKKLKIRNHFSFHFFIYIENFLKILKILAFIYLY